MIRDTSNRTNSQAYMQRALQVIPYGVNSNFRYWGEEDSVVVQRASGSHIWDVDGNRYVDYRLGFGPVILGHAYPEVTRQVAEAIQDGTVFALSNTWEVGVAERICRMTGMDKVRLSNTGTEATMHALRIARGYTGRDLFIKFEGQYHGMHDYVLFNTAGTSLTMMGTRQHPRKARSSAGIPSGMEDYVIMLPFNDLDKLEEALEEHGENVAAIMVEPLLGNAAGILPQLDWLRAMRELCDEYGIVLIFDEVKTGFRVAKGGAQEYFGVRADLAAYAKALGNGFPIAAVAGTDKVMSVVKPGMVLHGGTYVGNVTAVAAAEATLRIMEEEPVFETINQRGRELMDGFDEILERYGVPHVVTGIPSIFSMMLGRDTMPQDIREFLTSDTKTYNRIAWFMIQHGIMPDTDGREPWFMSYSHTKQDIAETLTVFEDGVKEITGHRAKVSMPAMAMAA